MKILISYFYNLRFFTPQMLPVSTAKWDPKWYHNNLKQDFIYRDSRGVINGVRCEDLVFPDTLFEMLEKRGTACEKNCKQSPPCDFMYLYKKYLDTLDFDKVVSHLELKCKRFQCDTAILMVHEPTTCKCSERPILVEWFREHNVEVEEFISSKLS